jgi:N-acylneuraminate cytidylyltransferase|tara:strand:+ start:8456 stop:9160 length:705 start_codon:yes stop_codon:yes gene_type:complete
VDTVAFIFARGGSKGLPGKNTRILCGKPLIGWAIEQAREVSAIRRIIVSTDSEEIASTAIEYGAEVPFMRPRELAQDNSPEWKAWRHALQYMKESEGKLPDALVSIPTTAPLRDPIDIENCLTRFTKGDCDAVITITEAHRSPWFNMVKMKEDGTVGVVIPFNGKVFRRQDTPSVYDVTTAAYVVDPSFVLANESLFKGRVRAVQVPIERAIDIDSALDFEMAEFLMQRRIEKR